MTLRARLLLLVVLAVIPAVCIEIYGEIELRSSRQREIHEEAMRLMRLAASEQARIGEGAKQLMIAFSEAPSVRHGDWASCNGTAVRIRDQVEGYSNIGIADLDGHILCAAVPPPPGYHARVSALASKDMASNDVVAGTYLIGKIVPGPHMAYAIPRRDDSGEVVGVVWAIIDLDWLAKHFADRFTSPNLTLLITDREGTILVRLPDQEAWVGKPVGDPYRFMLDAPDYGAADMAGVDGVERIIAYSPLSLDPVGLYVGVGLAKAPFFAPIDAATRQKALWISLSFALALVAAWLGGGIFIRRPINKLLVATRRWREGDYSARARLIKRSSEIGTLGQAFDEMADAVEGRERQRQAAEAALARLNAELEQRVKDEVGERERAQQALVQAQKIEAVGQLTSGVAHDFNNLLAAVLGNLELLRTRIADPRALKLIDGASRAAARGAKLTEQLLAFSRHHHLEPAPFEVNALIEGMSELLQRTIGPAIRITKSLAPEPWPALADASQVEVALLNLAINARDAMPLGGTLLIETANLPAGHQRLPRELAGDFVMIAVSDTGTGMSADIKSRAFEPFFTTKDIGKGTGLGLSMVYGVAKQSGGAVAIDSESGKGTTVAIFLPRAAAAAAASAAPADTAARTAGTRTVGRVLVVDDDRDVRDVTVAALADMGFETAAAENGRAALDMIERDLLPVDLIVVDFAMPGINGAEVIRRVRAVHPRLPAILITGYAEAGFADDLPASVQLLRKPFRVAELLARVNAGLAQTPPEAPKVLPLRPMQKPA